MFKIKLARDPEKFYRKQNNKVRRQISKSLRKLAENPRSTQAQKLAGMQSLYRVRCGDYRIVYRIEDGQLIVLVVRIAHRKDVYSNLT